MKSNTLILVYLHIDFTLILVYYVTIANNKPSLKTGGKNHEKL